MSDDLFQYIRKVKIYLKFYPEADCVPFHAYPERRLRGLQRKFWKRLLLDFHHNLKEETQQKLSVLAAHQSYRLSIDHTFRVVKNVVAVVPASRYTLINTYVHYSDRHL